MKDKSGNSITLVERHKIGAGHVHFEEIDRLCFLSKNLYNAANYRIRQLFIDSGKEKLEGKREHALWLRYSDLQKQLQNEKQSDYTALPAKVSQQVLMLLDKNWKSFFTAIKVWSANKDKFTGQPALPKYKDKAHGRNVLTYTIQAISKTALEKSIVSLSGTMIRIPTKQKNIQQVRIVPECGFYTIEIVYIKPKEVIRSLLKQNIAGIDIGVDNLAAVTSNAEGVTPLLINGRALKSINAYYNKKLARLKSLIGTGTSKRIRRMTEKRNSKIDHYLHCASKYIVQHLVSNDIGTLVIGKNIGWKQQINLGDKNNQNFVQIPHARFVGMLQYKADMVGIDVILVEESHTSKCSFIDNEPVQHQDKYLGKRVKRGLFVSKDGLLINADCNGSGNIIRKVFPNAFADGIQGVVVRPRRVSNLNPLSKS